MLSTAEHKALKTQAKNDGLSVADIVRQAVRTLKTYATK